MSSKRLPGKVLRPLGGRPVLARVIERVRAAAGADAYAILTSDDPSDDPIAEFARTGGHPVHRGSLDDVADRFASFLGAHPERAAFARVTGDSPFLDPAILARALGLFARAEADLVTNVHPRSFPVGQSVEVVRAATFLDRRPAFSAAEREHITSHFYAHPGSARIANFESGEPGWAAVRLAIDEPADLAWAESIVADPAAASWKTLAERRRA